MNKTLKLLELQPVEQNKTVIVYSPLDNPEILVRSGTPSTNSLYHAALHCYSSSFVQKIDKREKMVQNLLSELNNKGKNTSYYEVLHREILNAYSSPKNNAESILFELIPSYLYDRENFLDYISDISSSEKIDEPFSPDIKDNFCKYFFLILNRGLENVGDKDEKRKKFLQTSLLRFLEDKISSSLSLYKKEKEENKDKFSLEELDLLSKRLKTNIFLLDSKDRLPLNSFGYDKKYRKNMVLLSLEGEKFEPIGILREKNKVERLFNNNELLIEKIQCFLKDKDRFLRKYDTGKYLHSLVSGKKESKEKKKDKKEKRKTTRESKRKTRKGSEESNGNKSSKSSSESSTDSSHSRSDSISSVSKSKTPEISSKDSRESK